MKYQIEAERRIRMGVVGAGSHCYRNILPTLIYLPVELVAIADIDAERASTVARQFGARSSYRSAAAMYEAEELDAVLLVVSPQMHPKLTVEALNAGLHVYMEKPAATRAYDVEAMLAARGDRTVVVGYKKSFMPATRKAVELLADPANQPLRTLLGIYPISLPANAAHALERGEMNQWLANGCHPLSLLLELGGPVDEVIVHGGGHDGGAAILHHSNGALSNLHMALGAPRSQPNERYLIIGGEHSIEIENSRRLVYQRGVDFNYSHGTSYVSGAGASVWEAQNSLNSPENMAVMTQGLFGGLEHFCDSVLAGKHATTGSLEFALELTRVWEAILLSGGKPYAIRRG